MKKRILALLMVFAAGAGYGQNHIQNDINAARFVRYYNTMKPDSIYTLLSDAGRAKASKGVVTTATFQLKAALGGITSVEHYQAIPAVGGDSYIGVFEKSGPVLYIDFNKDHKLISFYTDEDKREIPGQVTIKAADAELKGTLTVPVATHKVPVVLIIAGSGPVDRDGNSAPEGLKAGSYLLLANSFKQNNIASLRYDKRGVGRSTTTKPKTQTTFDDMVNDAVAWIRFLKADKRFSKIIVAGHSEGSLIGMIACEREKVDGFVSLAGAGVTADEIMKRQIKATAPDVFYKRAVPIIDSIKAGLPVKQHLDQGFIYLFNASLQPYLHSWFQYNPQHEIAGVNVPVLIVQGTTDFQVSIEDAQLLKKAKPNAQVKLIAGMSHILKAGPADARQNTETYDKPDLPLHPQIVPALVTFIKSVK